MKKKTCFTDSIWLPTALASSMHFLVDGLCLCTLYLTASSFNIPYLMAIFATYNVLAFVTQPLTGWVSDRLRQRHWLLFLSIIALSLAVLVDALTLLIAGMGHSPVTLFAIASLLGLGNSLFHVWGGKETAVRTDNDIRALGVFVATGAFGLSVGILFYSWVLLVVLLVALCLLAVSYVWSEEGGMRSEERGMRCEEGGMRSEASGYSPAVVAGLVTVLMLFVMWRSFVGELISSSIHRAGMIVLLIGATAMLGKMAGGWIAKALGVTRAFVAMVLAVAVCYFARSLHEGFAFAGLFLVNCTMPVTLYWANCLLRGREGLAFGLLAAALIPGYLLAI